MSEEMTNGEPAPTHSKRLGRELAMEFLYGCDLRGELPGAAGFELFLDTVREEFDLKDNRLEHRAEDYARRLYEAVALHQQELDAVIAAHCRDWDASRISSVDRNILRVALAEMFHFDEVPMIVSIDEAVEIAMDFSGSVSGSFINGVLNAVKNEQSGNVGKGR